jgi:Zn-dependent alcohol dehydrogenase
LLTRAAVLYKTLNPMPIIELEQDRPKFGEVRVKIGAAGVCASDHHVMKGETNFPLPIVLGHEGSGKVVEVGEGVSNVKEGDNCILSFVPSCGFCRSCRMGLSQLCDTNRITGTRQYDGTYRLKDNNQIQIHQFAKLGVFSEYVIAPSQACYVIDDSITFETSALIGCAVTTGVGGVINQKDIRAGMSVAVFGAGGVGLNAIQGARLMNASRIVAVDIYDHKLEFAYKYGATDVINSKNQDPVKAIHSLSGDGLDFAFDTFGHSETTMQAFKSTRKGGTTVVIGLAPEGSVTQIPMVDIVRDQKSLLGSYYGSISPHETFRKILEFYELGRIDIQSMVTRRYKLAEINEAYQALDRGEDGRGVILFDD